MALTQEQQQILEMIKARIGESDLSDEALLAIYEEKQNVNCVAAEIWARKAGAAGDYIDITEGSSTRKLSMIGKQAREMVEFYGGLCASATGSSGTGRASRTRAIERP